jgi:hypothetical protein
MIGMTPQTFVMRPCLYSGSIFDGLAILIRLIDMEDTMRVSINGLEISSCWIGLTRIDVRVWIGHD